LPGRYRPGNSVAFRLPRGRAAKDKPKLKNPAV
jgi:hypothetical protein